jgi:hypothetical protein
LTPIRAYIFQLSTRSDDNIQVFSAIGEFKSVILHRNVDLCEILIAFWQDRISCICGSGYIFCFITLFNLQKSETQRKCPSLLDQVFLKAALFVCGKY